MMSKSFKEILKIHYCLIEALISLKKENKIKKGIFFYFTRMNHMTLKLILNSRRIIKSNLFHFKTQMMTQICLTSKILNHPIYWMCNLHNQLFLLRKNIISLLSIKVIKKKYIYHSFNHIVLWMLNYWEVITLTKLRIIDNTKS